MTSGAVKTRSSGSPDSAHAPTSSQVRGSTPSAARGPVVSTPPRWSSSGGSGSSRRAPVPCAAPCACSTQRGRGAVARGPRRARGPSSGTGPTRPCCRVARRAGVPWSRWSWPRSPDPGRRAPHGPGGPPHSSRLSTCRVRDRGRRRTGPGGRAASAGDPPARAGRAARWRRGWPPIPGWGDRRPPGTSRSRGRRRWGRSPSGPSAARPMARASRRRTAPAPRPDSASS